MPRLPCSRDKDLISPRASVLAAAIATLAVLVFAPALSGGFIYDDWALISSNVHVHSFEGWARFFTHDFWDVNEELRHFGSRMIYWRPGVSASYAADWQMGRGSPVLFHATNLLWHAAASCLAFSALRRWVGATVPAFFLALLFAVHPTKAESVAWIAGRTDVLCAAAMLLASGGIARRLSGQRGGILLELFGTALAYMMKEQAVVLFVFAAVETWVALGRPALDRVSVVHMARAAAPQLAVAAAYLVLRALLLPIRPAHATSLGILPHTAEVLETMGRFAALAFVPHDLSVQQGLVRTPGGSMAFDVGYVVLGAASSGCLAWAAFATRRRAPGVAVGISFYALTILPTSNVVSTNIATMVSERFLYLPVLGLALAGGALALEIERFGQRAVRALVAVACAAILAFAFVGARRAWDFQDENRFWARELRLHPESLEAWRFEIQRQMAEKRFGQALGSVARAESVAVANYRQTGYELDFVLQGAELALAVTPDRNRRSLLALDAFLGDISDRRDSVAALDVGSIKIELPLGGPALARRIDEQRPRLLDLRADARSRLDDDARAIEFAEAAHALCTFCSDVGRIAALVLARAGRYPRAEQILDDVAEESGETSIAGVRRVLRSARASAEGALAASVPAVRLKLRATELSTLQAWGRAFDVLAPAKQQIEEAPGFAIGFAELAWRAGEFDVARDLLVKWMPANEAERMTRAWTIKMGWMTVPEPRAEQDDRTPL